MSGFWVHPGTPSQMQPAEIEHDYQGCRAAHGLPPLGRRILEVVPPALGSYSASQAGTVALSASTSDYPPLPAGDPAQLGLIDYASRAIFETKPSNAAVGRN